MSNIRDKKILVVDDDKEILDMLRRVLNKYGFANVICTQNGEGAIKLCKEEKPHIVLLDIRLPDVDGYEVRKTIRTFSNVPILFLSALSDEVDRVASFVVGGDDYLAKPFSPREFLYRVKSNLGRLSVRDVEDGNKTIEVGDLEILPKSHIVKKRGKEISLYPIEFRLLVYFVENMNVVLSKEQLIEDVLRQEVLEDDKNTLRVYIKYLREKIEDDISNPRYIQTVRKSGYRFVGERN